MKRLLVCRGVCLVALIGSFAFRDCAANDFAQLQSAYLGDGWFQYTLTNLNDPFWQQADIQEFIVPAFSNIVEVGTDPADWQSQTSSGPSADWLYTGTPPQARPYQRVFLAHSSYTSYRLSTNAAMITAFVNPQEDLRSLVVETVFKGAYGNMAGLIPCPPEEADGSRSNLVSSVKLYPDVVINNILIISNRLYGLSYSWWSSDYTVLAQASTDLQNWTNIAYALGSPPSSTWTSSVPLDTYGNYFRLSLVATYHLSNLVGQASAPAKSPEVSPAFFCPPLPPNRYGSMISCIRDTTGKVVVQIGNILSPPRFWTLWVTDPNSLRYQVTDVVFSTCITNITFDPSVGPNPGIIHAQMHLP